MPHGKGQRILFIDDDEQLVFLAKRFLERIGYRVVAFTRPAEALAAASDASECFDLAVTDHNMPEMSGIDVATQLRLLRPMLPVVLSSGDVSDKLQEEALAAGVAEVFYKPDSIEGLCRAIHRAADAARPNC